jgi:hypothetical protein
MNKEEFAISHHFAQFHRIVTRHAPTADCENLKTVVAQPPITKLVDLINPGDRSETETRIKKVSCPAVNRPSFTSHLLSL